MVAQDFLLAIAEAAPEAPVNVQVARLSTTVGAAIAELTASARAA
jgi:hypothetical protein